MQCVVVEIDSQGGNSRRVLGRGPLFREYGRKLTIVYRQHAQRIVPSPPQPTTTPVGSLPPQFLGVLSTSVCTRFDAHCECLRNDLQRALSAVAATHPHHDHDHEHSIPPAPSHKPRIRRPLPIARPPTKMTSTRRTETRRQQARNQQTAQ